LLILIDAKGVWGESNDPRTGRALINGKTYKIGESIPVSQGKRTYSFSLVGIKFPDKIILKYKDETITQPVGKKRNNGD